MNNHFAFGHEHGLKAQFGLGKGIERMPNYDGNMKDVTTVHRRITFGRIEVVLEPSEQIHVELFPRRRTTCRRNPSIGSCLDIDLQPL